MDSCSSSSPGGSVSYRRWQTLLLSLMLVLGGVGIGWITASNLGWFPLGQAQEEPRAPGPTLSPQVLELERTLVEVAKKVTPAVVNIATTKVVRAPGRPPMSPFFRDPFFRRFFGDEFFRFFEIPRERVERSLGSGVIVTPGGYIVTNNHVVAGADVIKVTLSDRREFTGEVIGTDPKTDIAVIKIDGKDLPTVPWGDSDQIQVGELVLAIGNPFGLNQTVTSGIVSAKGRANVGIADYEDFIQTDAAINPGNSGGALVNLRGEIIGINTAIFTRTGGFMGIGFAVPSNMARAVMQSLIQEGKVVRGWLGVYIQEITPELARQFGLKDHHGALVSDVVPNSPAARAGFRRGDVIVVFNGKEVETTHQLRNLVAQTPPGTQVKVKVIRDGRTRTLQVTIEELPESLAEAGRTPGFQGSVFEGVTVENLTPALRDQLDLPSDIEGVVVTDVEPGSIADESGLVEGDVILEVNRRPVSSLREFRRMVRHLSPQESVLLLIYRRGTTLFMTLSPRG